MGRRTVFSIASFLKLKISLASAIAIIETMDKSTVTGRVYSLVFEILEANSDGVRWVDLLKEIARRDPDLHPKTVNGCVWKLVEKFPNRIYKPKKGLFRLLKYK